MAGVERHGFTDNFKAGAMTESIVKEKKWVALEGRAVTRMVTS